MDHGRVSAVNILGSVRPLLTLAEPEQIAADSNAVA
jgi:hypothetical protein